MSSTAGEPTSTPAAFPGSPGAPYALWADRAIAAIIDGLIATVAAVVMFGAGLLLMTVLGATISGLNARPEDAGGLAAGASCLSCCFWLGTPPLAYFVVGLWNKVYLVAKRGFSIGQGVVKIRVVTPSGTLVPTGTLVLRLLVTAGFAFVPLLPLIDLLFPLWDAQRQTLHDKAVGTFVVKSS